MKKYVLTKEQLKELLFQCFILHSLEEGGVDNWSWYSESLNDAKTEVFEQVEDEDQRSLIHDLDMQEFYEAFLLENDIAMYEKI